MSLYFNLEKKTYDFNTKDIKNFLMEKLAIIYIIDCIVYTQCYILIYNKQLAVNVNIIAQILLYFQIKIEIILHS